MRFAAFVLLGLAFAGATAEATGKQVIRYQGIYCDTGISSRGTRSVVCRPHDGTGYTVLMNSRNFVVMHCGGGRTAASCRPVLVARNR